MSVILPSTGNQTHNTSTHGIFPASKRYGVISVAFRVKLAWNFHPSPTET